MRSVVLIYGFDERLIAVRSLLLRHSGFRVFSTARPEEFRHYLRNESIAIVVLCYTLPPEDQDSAARDLRLHQPEAKVICLTSLVHQQCTPVADAFIPAVGNPALLIDTLRNLQGKGQNLCG